MDSSIWGRIVEATAKIPDRKRSAFLRKATGVSQPSVSRWRTGVNTPSLQNCIDMSRATGFTVQWLYTGMGAKRVAPANDLGDELIAILESADEAILSEILRFARFRSSSQ